MQIHGKLECSEVNGPGKRAVIWLQGCDINGIDKARCPQCWNQETHDRKLGKESFAHELYNWVEYCYEKHRIEGVTFSGGEPIHQIQSLDSLCWLLSEEMPWLSLGLYSGYSEKELDSGKFVMYALDGHISPVNDSPPNSTRAKMNGWARLKKYLDFGILGRFNAEAPSGDAMTTSTNQRIVFFSKRYVLSDFPPQQVELHITSDLVQVTGFPTA